MSNTTGVLKDKLHKYLKEERGGKGFVPITIEEDVEDVLTIEEIMFIETHDEVKIQKEREEFKIRHKEDKLKNCTFLSKLKKIIRRI